MKLIKKILVIDDSSTSVFLLENLLKEEGYDVITATTGEAGLKAIRGKNPDLVLLDIMMPGKSGFDVLEEMKKDEILASIPVIIISARVGRAEIEKGIGLGAFDYLTKPLDFDKFYDVLRRIEIEQQKKGTL
jgi:DNA-binding response OmpR family regulator